MKPSLGVTHAYRTARGEATLAAARADAAAATVTSMTAAPTSTTTTPAKRFHRNKRGVKVFSNAVPHGAMGKNKATTTTTLDDDSPAASRAAPELAPLHAGAAEFHPAPPQGSYRDAAAPSIETVARGDTPSGPLSNADSSGETSEDGDPTANESAVAGNNARAVDDPSGRTCVKSPVGPRENRSTPPRPPTTTTGPRMRPRPRRGGATSATSATARRAPTLSLIHI